MQILLAAATELEIKPFIINNPSADILVTGVGVPATIYHLTRRIQLIDYDLVIQAGIAGSFSPDLELGKVVLVKSDTFSDIGIQTSKGFLTIFEEGLANANQLPYKNGWLENTNPLLEAMPYEKLKAVTVNTVNVDKDHIARLFSKHNAVIETMEGAALHYVCLHEEVPFMQLRAISNYVGERDKNKWRIKVAIENLNKEIQQIIDRFSGIPNITMYSK